MTSVFVALVTLALVSEVRGHGALTKPMPRKVSGQTYCPWCVGEHQPVTNPYGSVHHDAELSSPCMGSQPGDAPYGANNFGSYTAVAKPGESSYTAGGTIDATVVLDADHNGEAQWSYCPHSEAQAEDCFRQRPLTDWIDVHAYWGGDSTQDHWKSGQWFPQTVTLPADMTTGPVTVRWLWVCKYTDEIFVSCFDTEIEGGASTSSTMSAGTTNTPVTTTTTTSTSSNGGSQEACIWTEPAGRNVQRSSREEKDGRICWDYVVEAGTTVYYQSKTDVYITWNADVCCLSAADTFGSAAGGAPNVVSFTSAIGSFGFCECTAWDPNNPGACAGQATAENMACPVLEATAGMCPEAASWDGVAVACSPAYTGTTSQAPSSTTALITTSSGGSSGEAPVFSTGSAGSSIDRLKQFVDALTDQPVSGSAARAVHSSGGAAGGVVSEGQAYGLLIAGAVLASMDAGDADRSYAMDRAHEFFLGWRRMCELSSSSGSCQEDEGFKCGGGQYPCLPHWKFGDNLTTSGGTGAAPDGDADAIAGMILTVMAVEQDSSKPGWYGDMAQWAYETCEQFYLSSTVDSSSGNHRIVKLGSCWGGWGEQGQNPSYHAPAVYRMCKHYMKLHDMQFGSSATEGDLYADKWDEVIDTSYRMFESVQCDSTGLITNWAKVFESADGQTLTAATGFSGSGTPGAEYGSEASRGVWRVALDYVLFPGEAAGLASSFLAPVAEHLETKESDGNWAETLDIDGGCLVETVHSSWSWNMFMAGPTFASLVCPAAMTSARQQAVIDAAGARLASRNITDYYSGSWIAISTLTLNGDLTRAADRLGFRTTSPAPQPSPAPSPAPAPTPAPSPTPSPAPSPVPVSTTPLSGDGGCCTWDLAMGCQGDEHCSATRANCEGNCHGTWLVLSTTTALASSTTSPTTTTSVPSTTTPSTTASSTTTTTTSSSATTSRFSSEFEPADGGVGRACRGSSAGDNSDSYYTLFTGQPTLSDCEAKCLAMPETCKGMEYGPNGRCEVWTRSDGIEATVQLSGYSCYRFVPTSTTATPTASASTTLATTTAASTSSFVHGSCGQLYDQCGGNDHYQGPDCCVSGLKCEFVDAAYSQCLKDDLASYSCSQLNEQCGGQDWTGFTCCAEGLACVWGNDFYSQCLKQPGSLLQGKAWRVQHDGGAGRLRGPRLRKSGKHAGALESKPWLVQRGSTLGEKSLHRDEEL